MKSRNQLNRKQTGEKINTAKTWLMEKIDKIDKRREHRPPTPAMKGGDPMTGLTDRNVTG